jgi:hypothetical protein
MFRTWIIRTLFAGLLATVATPSLAADPAKEEARGDKQAGKSKGGGGEARRKQRIESQAKRLDERAKRLRAEGKEKEAVRMESRAARLRKGASADPSRRGKAKSPEEARRHRKLQKLKSLKRKYGKGLDKPEVQSELGLHAERRAKLQRMKKLADSGGKGPLAERISKLMQMEDQRHTTEMNQLLGKADNPAVEASGKDTPVARPPGPDAKDVK